ncbi:MAG: ABC transporter ATP-binding protein [Clostridia bacterium]|nr:ABC transporter ATP-binding protein [Clostridia bacterium]
MKELLKYIGKYKFHTIMAPLCILFEVAIETLIPTVMGKMLIDKAVSQGNMDLIIKYGLLLAGLTLLALFFGIVSGKFASVASTGFAKNLRADMYRKIQKFSFANIDKFSTSSLVTRMTTDVMNVRQAFQMILRITVRAPLQFITAVVASLIISPSLAKYFLYVIPFLIIGLGFIIYKAHPWFEKVFSTYDDLNLTVQENVRSVREVKSYNLQDDETKKFNNVSEKVFKYHTIAEKIVAFNRPVMQSCIYAVLIIIAVVGAKLTVQNYMTTGELQSLISYALQIMMSLMMISMIVVMLTIAQASINRIKEVLNEVPDINNPDDPVKNVKDGSIEFRDVNFSYAKNLDKLSLKNVNIEIKSGETIGIIGGTGSSKTTLVQLIPRLYDVTSGVLLVGGEDVKKYDLKVLRDSVAMVLQKNVLFSGTIKENLRWGNQDATDEEIERACKLAQAEEFISAFPDKYDTYIEQGGTNVSGGQRQRLCIARALLKSPKILILDDSTSAVDTQTDSLIRKAFREQIPDITKLIIAQRISSVEDADKVIVMDDGEIVDFGTPSELMNTSKIYREVYDSQMKGGAINE